jgi:outer membrane receptor protein involved in Fe transport
VPIDDWLTVDLTTRLSLDAFSASPVLRNTSLGVSVANLFDRDPPRIVGAGFYPAGYDVANASPLGRFVALSMKKAW